MVPQLGRSHGRHTTTSQAVRLEVITGGPSAGQEPSGAHHDQPSGWLLYTYGAADEVARVKISVGAGSVTGGGEICPPPTV